jgi:hypothetical protein
MHLEIRTFLSNVTKIIAKVKSSIKNLSEAEAQLKLSDFELFPNTYKENLKSVSLYTEYENDTDFVTTMGIDDAELPTKFRLQQSLTTLRDAFENYKGHQWARLSHIYQKFLALTSTKTPVEIDVDLNNIITEIRVVGEQYPKS